MTTPCDERDSRDRTALSVLPVQLAQAVEGLHTLIRAVREDPDAPPPPGAHWDGFAETVSQLRELSVRLMEYVEVLPRDRLVWWEPSVLPAPKWLTTPPCDACAVLGGAWTRDPRLLTPTLSIQVLGLRGLAFTGATAVFTFARGAVVPVKFSLTQLGILNTAAALAAREDALATAVVKLSGASALLPTEPAAWIGAKASLSTRYDTASKAGAVETDWLSYYTS